MSIEHRGMDPNKLNSFKVPELKALLEERGLDTKGLKADLVARLKAALQSESKPASTPAASEPPAVKQEGKGPVSEPADVKPEVKEEEPEVGAGVKREREGDPADGRVSLKAVKPESTITIKEDAKVEVKGDEDDLVCTSVHVYERAQARACTPAPSRPAPPSFLIVVYLIAGRGRL